MGKHSLKLRLGSVHLERSLVGLILVLAILSPAAANAAQSAQSQEKVETKLNHETIQTRRSLAVHMGLTSEDAVFAEPRQMRADPGTRLIVEPLDPFSLPPEDNLD